MPSECKCIFCEGSARELPLAVVVPLSAEQRGGETRVCGWLTEVDDEGCFVAVCVPDAQGGSQRCFYSLTEAVRFVAEEVGVSVPDVAEVVRRIEVRMPDGEVRRLVEARRDLPLGRGSVAFQPYDARHVFCVRRDAASEDEPVPEARSKKKRPPARRPRHSASSGKAPSSSRPAKLPPPSPDRAEDDAPVRPSAYALESIGGDVQRVRELATLRSTWDSEIVQELHQCGALPPLYAIRRLVEDVGGFRNALCVFVDQHGRLVEGVWVPFGTLRILYGKRAQLLAPL